MLRRISSRVLRLAADLVEPVVSPGKRDDAIPANPPAELEPEAESLIAYPEPEVVKAEAPRPLRGSFADRMHRAAGGDS